MKSENPGKSALRVYRVATLQVLEAYDLKPLVDGACSQDLLALRPPDIDQLYPTLVPSADGSITESDIEKRRQLRAQQEYKNQTLSAQYDLLLNKKKAILSKMLADALHANAAGQLEIMREANPLTKLVGGGAGGGHNKKTTAPAVTILVVPARGELTSS